MRESTLHLFLLLIVTCLYGGCSKTENAIDLVPPSQVVVADESLLTISAPPGMSIARSLPLRSRFTSTLTDLECASSCGCTSAKLRKDSLLPGEVVMLDCTFKATATPQSRNVKLQLFSPQNPSGAFMLDLQIRSDAKETSRSISSSLSNLLIDEEWKQQASYTYDSVLTFGEKVPPHSIRILPSAEFVTASLLDSSLKLTLCDPPAGDIDENVEIAFTDKLDIYSLKLPIQGRIRPPLTIAPKYLNFSDIAPDRDMSGEILLDTKDCVISDPQITVTGDWKICSIERRGARVAIHVGLKQISGEKLRYGKLIVKGNWRGKPIVVPLTGDYASQSGA